MARLTAIAEASSSDKTVPASSVLALSLVPNKHRLLYVLFKLVLGSEDEGDNFLLLILPHVAFVDAHFHYTQLDISWIREPAVGQPATTHYYSLETCRLG